MLSSLRPRSLQTCRDLHGFHIKIQWIVHSGGGPFFISSRRHQNCTRGSFARTFAQGFRGIFLDSVLRKSCANIFRWIYLLYNILLAFVLVLVPLLLVVLVLALVIALVLVLALVPALALVLVPLLLLVLVWRKSKWVFSRWVWQNICPFQHMKIRRWSCTHGAPLHNHREGSPYAYRADFWNICIADIWNLHWRFVIWQIHVRIHSVRICSVSAIPVLVLVLVLGLVLVLALVLVLVLLVRVALLLLVLVVLLRLVILDVVLPPRVPVLLVLIPHEVVNMSDELRAVMCCRACSTNIYVEFRLALIWCAYLYMGM
jgi:hypothetical protein